MALALSSDPYVFLYARHNARCTPGVWMSKCTAGYLDWVSALQVSALQVSALLVSALLEACVFSSFRKMGVASGRSSSGICQKVGGKGGASEDEDGVEHADGEGAGCDAEGWLVHGW